MRPGSNLERWVGGTRGRVLGNIGVDETASVVLDRRHQKPLAR